MAKPSELTSELTRCAAVVEREMRRLEELSRGARNIKLSSEKNLAKAARGLQQALEQQERLAAELRTLGQAMLAMQGRQEAAMLPLQPRATELQARLQLHGEHMQRFGALGMKAKETVEALIKVAQAEESGAGSEERALLVDADARVGGLVEEARAMAEQARVDEFPDLAREAHALEQRVHAMRGRLAEIARAKALVAKN